MKYLLFLLALLLPAQSVIVVGHRASYISGRSKLLASAIPTSISATRYMSLAGDASTVANDLTIPMPVAGNFRKFYVRLNSDPDSGASSNGYKITIRKNAADTALTVTILSSTASFEAAYTGADVHFAAGDRIDMSVALSGTPATAVRFASIVEFQGDSGEAILLGNSADGLVSATSGIFLAFAQGAGGATENTRYTMFPLAGTITSFAAYLSTVPGTSKSRTLQLRQTTAGVTSYVGTPITYGAAENGYKQANQSVSVAVGDMLDVESDTSGSPAASKMCWSLAYVPTTPGEFVIPENSLTSGAGNRYFNLSGIDNSSTEATAHNLATADFNLLGWTGWLSAAPGGGAKKYTISLRQDSGTPTTTFSSDMTTQGPTTVSGVFVVPANYGFYDTFVVPTSSPTAAQLVISWIGILR